MPGHAASSAVDDLKFSLLVGLVADNFADDINFTADASRGTRKRLVVRLGGIMAANPVSHME
jgi:hypothetical protein